MFESPWSCNSDTGRFASFHGFCRYKLDSKDHWEEHADKTVDDRMADALKKRNLDPFSDSRPLEPEDFQKFDYIIGMNEQNFQEVEKAALYWKDTLNKPIPGNWREKVANWLVPPCCTTTVYVKAQHFMPSNNIH